MLPASKNDPEVIRMLREHRLDLIAREQEQTERMAREWFKIEQSLKDEMTLLALQIQEEMAKGSIITEQLLRRMDRYQKLNGQMKSQILSYAKEFAAPDIEKEQMEYGTMAIKAAAQAIKLSLGTGFQFDRLPKDAVETYVGLLGDGTPLYRLLKEAYPQSLDGVVRSILEGASRGLSPITMANNMADEFGIGLERITLIARTEQLRVNRLVSSEQYRASGLDGHMRRVATKDDAVCMACLASDGEFIPLDKELDDHPRGRCVAVFQIKGLPIIDWEKGPTWFERQDEDLQREMMGDKKYELWKAGAFDLADMRRTAHNDTWGDSPRVATIDELLDGRDASQFTFIPPQGPTPSPEPEEPVGVLDKYALPMDQLEDVIVHQDYETAGIYNAETGVMYIKDGEKSSVSFTPAEIKLMYGSVLTHNHPSGSPFSKEDLVMLGFAQAKEIRAIGRGTNYVFSMVNPNLIKYDELQVMLWMNKAIKEFFNAYKQGVYGVIDLDDWKEVNHLTLQHFADIAKLKYKRSKRNEPKDE